MMTVRHNRLGKLIRRGVRVVAARKDWSMTDCHKRLARELNLQPNTVRRWEQGRSKPSEENTMRQFVSLCVKWGDMDREWACAVLKEYGCHDVGCIMAEIFAAQEHTTVQSLQKALRNGMTPVVLELFVKMADVAVQLNQLERAVEWLGMVYMHEAANDNIRRMAERSLASLYERLPARIYDKAIYRGSRMKLDKAVRDLLSSEDW